MDTALALLLPLIGGFLFVKETNFIKYEVAREDGHRFYFRVSYYGLVLFFLSFGVFWLLSILKTHWAYIGAVKTWLIAVIGPMLKEPARAPGQINFLFICVLSVVLGRCAPWLVNAAARRTAEQAVAKAASKDEMESLLIDSMTRNRTISVTMSSGKVYAGTPIGAAEPKAGRKAIAMLPLMSGHREADGQVVFTTHYDWAFENLPANNAEHFRLVLPLDKVSSASFFDIATYEQFQKKHSSAKNAQKRPELRRVKGEKRLRREA